MTVKVLALATEAFGGRGGIAQSTRDLLHGLSKFESVADIRVLPRMTREEKFEVPKGIYQLLPISGRASYSARALLLAVTWRPDVVYCGHVFMTPLAHLVARLTGARLISHVHGLEVWQPLSRLARRGLAASDVILCVSRHTATKVTEAVRAEPAHCALIFNTVHERFTPGDRAAARVRFDLPPRARVLSTVSRLDAGQRHKGHDRVIPLLADLERRVPELVYVIAGSGDDRDRLAALARMHGVAHLVRFIGHVQAADLPDLYRASDLYVMPSHGEGFGIAFIEAMACGTPALGLDIGGAGEALRDGTLGHAVKEADFANRLVDLVTVPRPEQSLLATRTRNIFGRPRFEARLATALAPVMASRNVPKSTSP